VIGRDRSGFSLGEKGWALPTGDMPGRIRGLKSIFTKKKEKAAAPAIGCATLLRSSPQGSLPS
jgi:hypothetical protein